MLELTAVCSKCGGTWKVLAEAIRAGAKVAFPGNPHFQTWAALLECERCGEASFSVLTQDGQPYREPNDKQRMLDLAADEPDLFVRECLLKGYESILTGRS